MSQSYIRILDGIYANKQVAGVIVPLVEQFKFGAKGGFVTVNGAYFKKDRNIRIMLEKPTDFEFVTEAQYLEQDIALTPVNGNTEELVAAQAKPQESDDEIMHRIGERFEILHDMTRAACQGEIKAMIVTGPPGVGKSFGVELELERASLLDRVSGKRVRSEVVKGASTAIGLYQTLYKFSDKDNVIVFDDCDTLFFDDTSLNLLKSALDTGKRRKICWNAESSALRREGIPDTFDFKGSIIFITNLKFENISSKKLKDHLMALESRCHYLDLTLDSTRDKLLRIKQIVATGELFTDYEFSKTQEEEVIEFLFANHAKLREVSLRTALKIADLYRSFPMKWKQMAMTTVMKA
jgi:predicted AAA+ superfamily ATPase